MKKKLQVLLKDCDEYDYILHNFRIYLIQVYTTYGSFNIFTVMLSQIATKERNFWWSTGIYYLTIVRNFWTKFIAIVVNIRRTVHKQIFEET